MQQTVHLPYRGLMHHRYYKKYVLLKHLAQPEKLLRI